MAPFSHRAPVSNRGCGGTSAACRPRPSRTGSTGARSREGRRRPARPLELGATALVAGFDVVFADRYGDDLGSLAGALANHVIVVTLELFFAMRFGADAGWDDLFGNLVGGLLFVTLTRFGQAKASTPPRP